MVNDVKISKTELKQFKSIFTKESGDVNIPTFKDKYVTNQVIAFLIKNIETGRNNFSLNELKYYNRSEKKEIPLTESHVYKFNTKVINPDGTINENSWKYFQKEYWKRKEDINKTINYNLSEDIEDDEDDTKNKEDIIKPISPNSNIYKLLEYFTIVEVYDILSESRGDCKFMYDFESSKPTLPDPTIKTVQHWRIQIQSPIGEYIRYVRFHYKCPKCGADVWRNYNEVVSTKGVVNCDNMIPTDSGTMKECRTRLTEPTQLSDSIVLYRYDASYTNGNEKYSILVESLQKLENFEYDCAGVVMVEHGNSYLFVLDVKPIQKHKMKFPTELAILPETSPNQIPNIIKYFDNLIYKYSGDKILGMYDIKFYFIIQKLTQILNWKRNWNIALSGENDIGKTYIIDRYGSFLYGGYYKKTFGQSISIPALRGSSRSNREILIGNKNRLGLLNTFDCIYIDEIFENQGLMEELKPILLEDTFSNDKADGDRIEYKKQAQLCIAENPNAEHLSLYEGMIKKMYNEKLIDGTVNKVDEYEAWDNKWDLYQPLYTYTNTLLRHCIEDVRKHFLNQGKHFIDGRSISIHDRFPVYLNLKRDKDDETLHRTEAVVEKSLIAEQEYVELKKKLAIDNINDYFKRYKKFIYCKYDTDTVQKKINELIKSFNFKPESRLIEYCIRILNSSRILNQRETFNDIDYEYVSRYLYTKDRRVGISELENINPVSNLPDLSILNEDNKDNTIISTAFGLKTDDFDNNFDNLN